MSLTLYYVAVDDDGRSGEKIGCGDSLLPVYTEPVETSSQLETSIERLIADRDERYDGSGLYNALHQSDLSLERAEFDSGVVQVYLSGKVVSGGACDDPRIVRQLQQTAATAVGADAAEIYVNDTPLEEVLSGK